MQTLPGLEVDGGKFTNLEPGEYPFVVKDAEEKQSKKGNEMIALTLNVIDINTGRERLVWDWLVGTENCEWKTRHFCKAVGLDVVYESGNLSSLDCLHCKGRVQIKLEKDAMNADQMRNVVGDYVVVDTSGVAPHVEAGAGATPTGEDDIPFN